jgi:hypothetical protein
MLKSGDDEGKNGEAAARGRGELLVSADLAEEVAGFQHMCDLSQ